MPDTPNHLWYKDAVIYQATPRVFRQHHDVVGDSPGDAELDTSRASA